MNCRNPIVTAATTATLILFPVAFLQAGSPSSLVSPSPDSLRSVRDDGWWIHSTSYGWLAAQEGDIRIGALSLPIDASLTDVINGVDELDMGFMGGLEAGRGRWSIGIDMTYAKASDTSAGDGLTTLSTHLEQSQWMINPFVTYQLLSGDRWHVDAIVGARINIFDMEIESRLIPAGVATVGGSDEWVDPLFGLRGRRDLTERLTIGYRFDIGGFGLGSDLTWQAYVGMGWKLTPSTTLALGYRGLSTDYNSGDFAYDTVSHGPLVGLQFTF